MALKRLLPYKDAIIDLYNHVGDTPFYTQDVAHIFPPQRICMLTNRGLIEPTGNFKQSGAVTSHNRKHNEWKFTPYGVAFIDRYL